MQASSYQLQSIIAPPRLAICRSSNDTNLIDTYSLYCIVLDGFLPFDRGVRILKIRSAVRSQFLRCAQTVRGDGDDDDDDVTDDVSRPNVMT